MIDRTLDPIDFEYIDPTEKWRIGTFPHESWLITSLGRYIPINSPYTRRKDWHHLNKLIYSIKNARYFPEAVILAIRDAINTYTYCDEKPLIVTVIPHKFGRSPHMACLLKQLSNSHNRESINKAYNFTFVTDMFYYDAEAPSFHINKMSRRERFESNQRNLHLTDEYNVFLRNVIVLDDVVTSGSTLIRAADLLDSQDSCIPALIAIAKTISSK